jgi:hypothetical protein
VSAEDEQLDANVTAALADVEASAALTDRWRDRLREDGADEVESNYLPLDITYERAEVIGTWPNGEPMTIFYGCRGSED